MNQSGRQGRDIIQSEAMLRSGGYSVKLSGEEVAYMNFLPTLEIVSLLEGLMGSEDLALESRAFDGLMNLHNFDRVGYLCSKIAASSHKDWRTVYCEHLAGFRDPRVIPALCHILSSDEDPDVRLVAAEQLGEIGDASAIPVLERAALYDRGEDFEGRLVSDAARDAAGMIRGRLNEGTSDTDIS